jgi:hypothetical protein
MVSAESRYFRVGHFDCMGTKNVKSIVDKLKIYFIYKVSVDCGRRQSHMAAYTWRRAGLSLVGGFIIMLDRDALTT